MVLRNCIFEGGKEMPKKETKNRINIILSIVLAGFGLYSGTEIWGIWWGILYAYVLWSWWWSFQLLWARNFSILASFVIGLPVGFFGGGIYKFIKYLRGG